MNGQHNLCFLNKNALYAFYGSLRRGLINYEAFGKGALNYLGTHWLEGFRIYSLGEYPYAVRSNGKEKICAELFQITNREVEKSIHDMELEAEYYYDEVDVDGRKFGIYLFRRSGAEDPWVSTGDWLDFIRNGGV